MCLLTVEHHGHRRKAPLARRVLIGRRTGNHVVIDDPAVSMIHAWIDRRGDQCVLTDTGSRTGTLVNGKRITRPLPLCDGDRITVGPATLTFHGEGEPATAAAPATPAARSRATGRAAAAAATTTVAEPAAAPAAPPASVPPGGPHARGDQGVLFDCACGAPLWAGSNFAGRSAYCRYCGRQIRVPTAANFGSATEQGAAEVSETVTRPAAAAPPAAQPAAPPPVLSAPAPVTAVPPPARPDRVTAAKPAPAARPARACGICQTGIGPDEATTSCPSCGLTFHADCWVENRGCAAYGCPQVGALEPKKRSASAAGADRDETDDGIEDADPQRLAEIEDEAQKLSQKPPMPWEHLVLAASVGCLLLSTLTFGAPSLLLGVGTMVYLSRTPGVMRKTGVLLLATFLAFVGFVGGLALSWFWWIGGFGATP